MFVGIYFTKTCASLMSCWFLIRQEISYCKIELLAYTSKSEFILSNTSNLISQGTVMIFINIEPNSHNNKYFHDNMSKLIV